VPFIVPFIVPNIAPKFGRTRKLGFFLSEFLAGFVFGGILLSNRLVKLM